MILQHPTPDATIFEGLLKIEDLDHGPLSSFLAIEKTSGRDGNSHFDASNA